MTWMLFLALGILAALVAQHFDSRRVKGGILSAVFIGGIGALIGGIVANIILGQTIFTADMATFVIATMAVLLIITIHRTMYLE